MLACTEMITMCLQSAKREHLRSKLQQQQQHQMQDAVHGLSIFHDVSSQTFGQSAPPIGQHANIHLEPKKSLSHFYECRTERERRVAYAHVKMYGLKIGYAIKL